MHDDVIITLYGDTEYTKDDNGNEIAHEAEKTVFGEQKSVYAAEFYAAGKQGIKPSCMVKIYTDEYGGEKYISVDGGERLSVYRTYRTGEKIELYCTERTGEQ